MLRHRGAPSRNGRSERLSEPLACSESATGAPSIRSLGHLISYNAPFWGDLQKPPRSFHTVPMEQTGCSVPRAVSVVPRDTWSVPRDPVLTRAAGAGGDCSSARGRCRKAVVSLTTSVEHLHYTRRSIVWSAARRLLFEVVSDLYKVAACRRGHRFGCLSIRRLQERPWPPRRCAPWTAPAIIWRRSAPMAGGRAAGGA